MKKPKSLVKVVLLAPPVKRYLQEKVELNNSVAAKSQEIKRMAKEAEDLKAEINLLKGIVPGATKINWPVFKHDLFAARPIHKKQLVITKKKSPFKVVWVLPPMGQSSGGHTSIFRTIKFLESNGHKNVICFYDAMSQSSPSEVKHNMQFYPTVKAKILYNTKEIEDCDAIFATNWFTAYPVFNYAKPAKKYYFVQDFEPFFEAAGSYNTLAENTYKFGFHGVTIGDWLKEKLTNEYGMECDSFPFGVNIDDYNLQNENPRKDVFFYARPVTPRRGFELGIVTLEAFHRRNPNVTIHMAGWDVGNFNIPFPYQNHKILDAPQLNSLYNKCGAGLVLSFTNMSLLPLEIMSSGCMPVINEAHHTRMFPYNKLMEYALPNPEDLAIGLEKGLIRNGHAEHVKKLAKAAQHYSWDESYEAIEIMLQRDLGFKMSTKNTDDGGNE